eukprot:gene9060-16178_t
MESRRPIRSLRIRTSAVEKADFALRDIQVVLVAPKSESNIGAVARCCANFEAGFMLYAAQNIHDTASILPPAATSTATSTAFAIVVDTLELALADSVGSVGFTRRTGATRHVHASLAHMVSEFPSSIPSSPPLTIVQDGGSTSITPSPTNSTSRITSANNSTNTNDNIGTTTTTTTSPTTSSPSPSSKNSTSPTTSVKNITITDDCSSTTTSGTGSDSNPRHPSDRRNPTSGSSSSNPSRPSNPNDQRNPTSVSSSSNGVGAGIDIGSSSETSSDHSSSSTGTSISSVDDIGDHTHGGSGVGAGAGIGIASMSSSDKSSSSTSTSISSVDDLGDRAHGGSGAGAGIGIASMSSSDKSSSSTSTSIGTGDDIGDHTHGGSGVGAGIGIASMSSSSRDKRSNSMGMTALVFGREESGLTEEELRSVSHACAIPTGRIQASLNLSHATSVVLAEVVLAEVFQRRWLVSEGESLLFVPGPPSNLASLADSAALPQDQGPMEDDGSDKALAPASNLEVEVLLKKFAAIAEAAGVSNVEVEVVLKKIVAIAAAAAAGVSGEESRSSSGNHGRRRLPLGNLRALLQRSRINRRESRSLHGLASAVLNALDPGHPLEQSKKQNKKDSESERAQVQAPLPWVQASASATRPPRPSSHHPHHPSRGAVPARARPPGPSRGPVRARPLVPAVVNSRPRWPLPTSDLPPC